MKIYCSHCKHLFKAESHQAGDVQYSKCKSVFRVEFILKSPCPHCHKFLKLVPDSRFEYVGIPLDSKEKPPTKDSTIRKPISKSQSQTQTQKSQTKTPSSQLSPPQPSKTKTSDSVKKEIIRFDVGEDPKERLKKKLQQRFETYQRYSVQTFKHKEKQKKKTFPSVKLSSSIAKLSSKLTKKFSNPKVYLTIFSIMSLLLMLSMMKTVFKSDETLTISSIDGIEEYEPTHDTEPLGGPIYSSEEKKGGLEDETIKKINSNLQILHLPPLRQVTSTYGVRLDPFTKKLAFHAGVDFKANLGTKIEAAMDGVVKHAGKKAMYGNAVIIKHKNGYETLYGHLSKILVQKGQKIGQKGLVGLAGSSGRSTGPHLHFELIKSGKKIDPLQADLISMHK